MVTHSVVLLTTDRSNYNLFTLLHCTHIQTNAMQQWNILFWIGAAIYVFGAVVFVLGVNSNPEKWGQRRPAQSETCEEGAGTATAAAFGESMEKSKNDYAKSKCNSNDVASNSPNQVNIDINNNYSNGQKKLNC